MSKLNIIGTIPANSGGVWFVSEDRKWKVMIEGEDQMSAIYQSREMYRIIGNDVYDVRSGKKIWKDSIIAGELFKLNENARTVAARMN